MYSIILDFIVFEIIIIFDFFILWYIKILLLLIFLFLFTILIFFTCIFVSKDLLIYLIFKVFLKSNLIFCPFVIVNKWLFCWILNNISFNPFNFIIIELSYSKDTCNFSLLVESLLPICLKYKATYLFLNFFHFNICLLKIKKFT